MYEASNKYLQNCGGKRALHIAHAQGPEGDPMPEVTSDRW